MDFVNINGTYHIILDEITINNKKYVYLAAENSPLNVLIKKIVIENGKEYLDGLDTDDEVINALDIYYQKHKEEIGQ
ncbi:MAG: hypothetical protein ACLUFU_02630 [Bacilli bacterium]